MRGSLSVDTKQLGVRHFSRFFEKWLIGRPAVWDAALKRAEGGSSQDEDATHLHASAAFAQPLTQLQTKMSTATLNITT